MALFNRTYKDSVFVDLFKRKENFLSLYNSIHKTNLKLEDTQMELKEIPQSVYKTFNNDVSMLVNGRLIVMVEHQSTINENMPLRFLEFRPERGIKIKSIKFQRRNSTYFTMGLTHTHRKLALT